MSLISKFIISLRTRRNLTDLKVAQRAHLSLTEYNHIEAHPESVPLERLYDILRAMEVTEEEFAELHRIIYCMVYKQKPLENDNNVLPFKSKVGLNGRRRKKLTRQKDNEK